MNDNIEKISVYVKRCLTFMSDILSLENLQARVHIPLNFHRYANNMSTSQRYVVYMKISKYNLHKMFSYVCKVYIHSLQLTLIESIYIENRRTEELLLITTQ